MAVQCCNHLAEWCVIDDQPAATPGHGVIEVGRANLAKAGGVVPNGPARRDHRLRPLAGRCGQSHFHGVLDDDDLDAVGHPVDQELRAQGACRAVGRRDHEGPPLAVRQGRCGEIGQAGQQVYATFGVVVADRDGAVGTELHGAAVGQGDAVPFPGRGPMVGGQQDDRVAQPEACATGQNQQARHQRARPQPKAVSSPVRGPGRGRPPLGCDVVGQDAGREVDVPHLFPGRPGFVEHRPMQRVGAQPMVEVALFGLAQGPVTQAGDPGRRGRIDGVTPVFWFVHLFHHAPSDTARGDPRHGV